MTTIYRIKDYETDWTSKWNEDKDAVIKQLDDYVDSCLGEVVLGSFVVIQALVLEDIDEHFLIEDYAGIAEAYQWSENEDGFAVLGKVDKNKLKERVINMEQPKLILQTFETNKAFKDKLVEMCKLQGEDFTVINALIYLFSKVCELRMDEQVLEDLENKYDGYDIYVHDNEFMKELEAKYPAYKESLLDGIDEKRKEDILFLARAVAELIKLDLDHEFHNDQSDLGNGEMGYLFDIKFGEDGYHLLFTSAWHQIKILSLAEDDLLTKTR